jgi:hypothetical protein
MVRMLSIYLLVLFAVAMIWYITNQLKNAYASLKNNRSLSAVKSIFLLLTFVLFTAAGAQSFFESPEDIASHVLLIMTTILLSFALVINKASTKGLLQAGKRYALKLKMAIAYQLIKFGKHK